MLPRLHTIQPFSTRPDGRWRGNGVDLMQTVGLADFIPSLGKLKNTFLHFFTLFCKKVKKV